MERIGSVIYVDFQKIICKKFLGVMKEMKIIWIKKKHVALNDSEGSVIHLHGWRIS